MSANDNPTLAGVGLRVTDDRTEHPVSTPAQPTSATHFVPAGRFGPWVPGIAETERRRGLRALGALVTVYCGSNDPAVAALRRAEADTAASDQALAALDALPPLNRRKIIATYATVMSTSRQRGGA
jgi:hypothetical protein